MADNMARIQVDVAHALTQRLDAAERTEKNGLHASAEAVSATNDAFIAVIESRTFIRECIRRSMQSEFPLEVQAFSEAHELQQQRSNLPKLIILSGGADYKDVIANLLKNISEIVPKVPIIVLAYNNDAEMAKVAISCGAKGYIPVTMGFEIAVRAVRFVLAGGTYVPIDYLLMRTWPEHPPSEAFPAPGLSRPANSRSFERSSVASRTRL